MTNNIEHNFIYQMNGSIMRMDGEKLPPCKAIKLLQSYQKEIIELEKENQKLKQKLNELSSKVDDKEVAVEVETCKIMEKVFQLISYYIVDIANLENEQYGNDCCRINQIILLRQLEMELKK